MYNLKYLLFIILAIIVFTIGFLVHYLFTLRTKKKIETKIKRSKRSHIDFVSNVSHELKTPLTAMQGFVELLIHDLSQKKFDQFDQFLNILLRNCKRISDLVDDLLKLSTLSSKDKIEKQKLSTKEITYYIVKSIEQINRNLHYSFNANYVMANRRWLEVILRNLIDNACRHTSEDGEVYIKWAFKDNYTVLTVSDNGEGVPAKYRQRIFERFFRMDSARSRETGGTGVGLALVKETVEKQGGQVEVTSSQTGGAQFICKFPNS